MKAHHRMCNDWNLIISLIVVIQLQVRAAIPDAEVWIKTTPTNTDTTVFPFSSPLLVTYGLFGDTGRAVTGPLAFPPDGDDLLCNEANGLVDYRSNQTVPSATSTGRKSSATTFNSSSHISSNSTTNSSTLPSPPNFSLPLYLHHEVLLVARGNCSFERKTLSAQRLGASGILIYNTLQSRYGWNATSQRVIYPVAKTDYECSNGQDSNLSFSLLRLDPPRYNASFHNPLLTLFSPNNLCHLAPSSQQCASQRCLVTEPAMNTSGDGAFTTCCAWDISETMNEDTTISNTTEPVHIAAVFLTMAQGDALVASLSSSLSGTTISIHPRLHPKWNASFFLLWLVGTFAVSLAAWNSAHEYRYTMLKLRQVRQRRERRSHQDQDDQATAATEVGAEQTGDAPASERNLDLTTPCPETTALSSQHGEPTPPSTRVVTPLTESTSNPIEDATLEEPSPMSSNTNNPAEAAPESNRNTWSSSMSGMFQGSPLESVEIEIWHVVIFLVVASTLLFLLFFFKFYRFVVVLYAFGCAGAVSLIVVRPFLERLEQLCLKGAGIMLNDNRNSNNNEDGNDSNPENDNRDKGPTFLHRLVLGDMLGVTWLDIFSATGGYLWSALWLYVYFTQTDPSEMPFYWISQDVFGVALCVLILSLIKLNSMRIGTILLVAVFFYDIFFVFLTPYLFNGKSIMVSVATSGGSPEGTADFCEKYPRDHSCRGGNPLPFLFTVPRINDYRGGSSLLGLGDVVLPGILLSFAARLDEARRLLNRHTTLSLPEAPERWYQGYFPPLIAAYLFGLLMANCAVVWMQRGQPALLYLVPSCLGTFLVLGRRELKDLWKGPKHLRWADRLVRYVLRRV